MKWFSRVLTGSAGLALLAVATGFSPARPTHPTVPAGERQSRTHSHNDYERNAPLWDALQARMDSVEADIWLSDGQLKVAHWQNDFKGTLEELYLKPLARLVEEKGSVYGDGKAFYLWIDFKQGEPDVVGVLAEILNRYGFLTQFTDMTTRPGAVTVILTGDEKNKKRYVDELSVRRAVRDAEYLSASDPDADNRWQWYALNWYDLFRWSGYGKMPPDERAILNNLVRTAHSKGRKLRLFGTPEEEDLWNEALAAKVDMIGTDEPERLRRFVSAP